MITSHMLPRQLTPPPHPPAKLTPSLSCSYSLLCAPKKINSHQIDNFQPLFAKHPGVGSTPPLPRRASLLRHMHHVAPLSPLPSLDCAYFLSPRGCGVRQLFCLKLAALRGSSKPKPPFPKYRAGSTLRPHPIALRHPIAHRNASDNSKPK